MRVAKPHPASGSDRLRLAEHTALVRETAQLLEDSRRLYSEKRFAESARLVERILHAQERLYGEQSPYLVSTLRDLVQLHWLNKEPSRTAAHRDGREQRRRYPFRDALARSARRRFHAFFLADDKSDEPDRVRGMKLVSAGAARQGRHASAVENPLLRSGPALAGANERRGDGGEDGILTALEAAGLDFWGTKLVVLSACETGVSEVRNGEGVYGLRRALVPADSETQVMSLWHVSDAATRDLMTGYYRRLAAGEGRTEALRQVQLLMLRDRHAPPGGGRQTQAQKTERAKSNFSHPFFWASFIQSGDWRRLEWGRAR